MSECPDCGEFQVTYIEDEAPGKPRVVIEADYCPFCGCELQ